MIQLRYFASLRDQLNSDGEALPWQDTLNSVAAIKNLLSSRNATWKQTLANPSVLVAVNQTMGTLDSSIKDGDEIAFFPPVTGG